MPIPIQSSPTAQSNSNYEGKILWSKWWKVLKLVLFQSLSLLMILPAFLAVQADKPPPSYNPQPQPSYGGNQDAPAQYNFQWSVLDNPSQNNYGQQESRDGSNTVGSYYVLLPDGRTQRVSYTVDAYGGKILR